MCGGRGDRRLLRCVVDCALLRSSSDFRLALPNEAADAGDDAGYQAEKDERGDATNYDDNHEIVCQLLAWKHIVEVFSHLYFAASAGTSSM